MARLIAVSLMLVFLPGVPVHASTDWRSDQCRYAFVDHRSGFSYSEIVTTIECVEARWHSPGGVSKAISVGTCESGLRADAVSPGGSYIGVFQQAARYWPGRLEVYRPRWWRLDPSAYNARSNVTVSIRMAGAQGWGAWSCS